MDSAGPSGTHGPDEGSEARWAAAAQLAAGAPDAGLSRRRTLTIIRAAVLLLAVWIVGIVLALVFLAHHLGASGTASNAAADVPRLVVGTAFVALGVVVCVVGVVRARRSGRLVPRWRAIASPLSRSERRSLGQQIRGREEPDPARLGTVVAAARQSQRALVGIAWIYPTLAFVDLGQGIVSDLGFVTVINLVVAVVLLVLPLQLVVLYRRTARFVARYGPAVVEADR